MTQPKSLVYLACPYSDVDPYVRADRFNSVNRMAAMLMAQGCFVFSPISHSHPIAEVGGLPLNWDFWKEYNILMLDQCSKLFVLMLPGWQTSKGVQAEIEHALARNIPVDYIVPSNC